MNLQHIEERFEWMKSWLGNTTHARINNAFGGNMRVLTCDEFLHCKGLYHLVIDNTGFIPPMTDPLGKHWMQPHHNQITLRNGFAIMNKYSFDLLKTYDWLYPTGVYGGKMWKRQVSSIEWKLCWFDKEFEDGTFSIEYRIIKIEENNFLYMYDEKRTLIIESQVDDFEYYKKLQKKQQDNLIKAHYTRQ